MNSLYFDELFKTKMFGNSFFISYKYQPEFTCYKYERRANVFLGEGYIKLTHRYTSSTIQVDEVYKNC